VRTKKLFRDEAGNLVEIPDFRIADIMDAADQYALANKALALIEISFSQKKPGITAGDVFAAERNVNIKRDLLRSLTLKTFRGGSK
jgi:hypothetical protein